MAANAGTDQHECESHKKIDLVVGNGTEDCCLKEGRRVAERFKVDNIKTRRFTHTELWAALDPILKPGTRKVTKFGESLQGRALNAITVGNGPASVLLCSQMHGDESTATMTLAGLLAWCGSRTRERDVLRETLLN